MSENQCVNRLTHIDIYINIFYPIFKKETVLNLAPVHIQTINHEKIRFAGSREPSITDGL